MQKKVGNTLYVFDTTPFTITEDTDAQVIYVQNECLKGYLELNTELADKIHGFNQFLMTIKPVPWADGVTQEPTKNYHLLTVSGGNTQDLWVQNYDESMPPGNNNESYFDSYVNWQIEAGMIGPEERNKIYCNAGAIIYIDGIGINEFETISEELEQITIPARGEHYGVIMGDSDMTVDFSYTLKPTHHVNFSTDSNASADIEIDPQERYAGGTVWIRFKNNQSSSTITVTSSDVELTYDQDNDEYSFTMPDHDVTIKAVYATEQPQNYHLLTIPGYAENTKQLYVYGFDTNIVQGVTATDWFHVINEKQRNAGMIDAGVTDKIYCNTGAQLFVFNEPDDFETVTGLNIINNERYGERYGFVMGDSDMTVDFSYTLKPKYHINFSEDSTANNDVTIYPYEYEQIVGNTVLIWFKNDQSSSTITVTSSDVELSKDTNNDRYRFIMPDHDVTIKAVYKPIEISINLGDTDLTYSSATPYDPSGTYYPHKFFVIQVPEGKTTDNYTFVKSDDKISVNPVSDHFDMEFKVSGTVTFANA